LVNPLKIIKIVPIKPSKFQETVIEKIQEFNDPLGFFHEYLSNIILPNFDDNNNFIVHYGLKAINKIEYELQKNKINYNNKLKNFINKFNKNINVSTFLSFNKEYKTIEGYFFNVEIIKYFSIKYYFIIKLLEKLNGLVLIYSNYVRIGINLIKECLIENGYEDVDSPKRGIDYLKKCFLCNIIKGNHENKNHEFIPIRFFILTSDLRSMKILNQFNSSENIFGNKIKIILGSKGINEGLTFKNIRFIIKVDSVYTITKEEQINKRGIRINSHLDYLIKLGKLPLVIIINLALATKINSKELINFTILENKFDSIKEIYDLLEEISIDKYAYTNTLIKPVNHATSYSFLKNININEINELLINLIKVNNMILYDDIIDFLKKEYNIISIMLSLQYLKKNNIIDILNFKNTIYILKKSKIEKNKNYEYKNLNNYINIKNLKIREEIENDAEVVDTCKQINYIFEYNYFLNKVVAEIYGILQDTFKLQFSIKISNKLNLNLIEKKNFELNEKNLLKGWICSKSIKKNNLVDILNYLKIEDYDDKLKNMCDLIFIYFKNLEKYNDKNISYLIYPINHEEIKFPLNIYDNYFLFKSNIDNKKQKIIEDKKIDLGVKFESFDNNIYTKIKYEIIIEDEFLKRSTIIIE
jgi:hypothetical protein